MIVKLLKECEADIEISDYDRRSVGHLAAAEGHTELLIFLINETNFDFNLKDRWGKKPLEEIADEGIREEFEAQLRKRILVHGRRRGSSKGESLLGDKSHITTNFKTGEIETSTMSSQNLIENEQQQEELEKLVNK
jgi:hypothetical protein